MKTLFILFLCFAGPGFAQDAKIEIIGVGPNESLALGHSLKFNVYPFPAITGPLKAAKFAKLPDGEKGVKKFGPLLADLNSIEIIAEPNPHLQFSGILSSAKETQIPALEFEVTSLSTPDPISLQTQAMAYQASSNLLPGDEQKPVWLWGLISENDLSWTRITLAILVGLGILGGIAYWIYKKFIKNRRMDRRSPEQRAREVLAALQKEGNIKTFSYKLVAITKNLLEQRAGGGFSDLTDSELLAQVKARQLPDNFIADLKIILEGTLEVRYAHSALEESQRRKLLDHGSHFVDVVEAWIKTQEAKQ